MLLLQWNCTWCCMTCEKGIIEDGVRERELVLHLDNVDYYVFRVFMRRHATRCHTLTVITCGERG